MKLFGVLKKVTKNEIMILPVLPNLITKTKPHFKTVKMEIERHMINKVFRRIAFYCFSVLAICG